MKEQRRKFRPQPSGALEQRDDAEPAGCRVLREYLKVAAERKRRGRAGEAAQLRDSEATSRKVGTGGGGRTMCGYKPEQSHAVHLILDTNCFDLQKYINGE